MQRPFSGMTDFPYDELHDPSASCLQINLSVYLFFAFLYYEIKLRFASRFAGWIVRPGICPLTTISLHEFDVYIR